MFGVWSGAGEVQGVCEEEAGVWRRHRRTECGKHQRGQKQAVRDGVQNAVMVLQSNMSISTMLHCHREKFGVTWYPEVSQKRFMFCSVCTGCYLPAVCLASSVNWTEIWLTCSCVVFRRVCVFQLLAVVSELQRQGLNILVLGRKHMLHPSRSWDRRNMDLIRQKAQCFFTDNMWAPDNNKEKMFRIHSSEKKQTKQTSWWYCDLKGCICEVCDFNNFLHLLVQRTIPSCCTPLCTLGITVASWAGTWWGTTRRACRTEPPDGSSSNGSEVTSWSWMDTWQQAGESNFWWGGGEADTRRKGC